MRVSHQNRQRDCLSGANTDRNELLRIVSHGDTNYNWCTWNNTRKIDKGTKRHRNQRTSKDHPNYNITKIDQNTEKSPGDLRRLAVTQPPVKNYQLMLA